MTRSQLRDLRTTNDSSQAKLMDHSERQGTFALSRFASLPAFPSRHPVPLFAGCCKESSLTFLAIINRGHSDQETMARLAEADLMTEDLERANSRVAEVQRRNEKLRVEIEAVRSGSEGTAQ